MRPLISSGNVFASVYLLKANILHIAAGDVAHLGHCNLFILYGFVVYITLLLLLAKSIGSCHAHHYGVPQSWTWPRIEYLIPTNNIRVLYLYFKLTNKSYLIHRIRVDQQKWTHVQLCIVITLNRFNGKHIHGGPKK